MAKLTNTQAKEIRKLYATGEYTHEKLGKMYNISTSAAGYIVRGESYES